VARTGENAAEILRQRKKTAQDAIDKGRRLTAGLHVAAGKFTIGDECLANLQEKLKREQEKKRQNMFKLKDEYDNLLAKVNAVKAANMPPEKWLASRLHVMVKWYKRDDDNALPRKKSDLLTRYLETCNWGDWGDRLAPLLLETPQLDPIHQELLPISIDNDDRSVEDVLALPV